jgi:hypothetical protein
MALIIGVGPGLFALLVIWTVCLLACLVLSRADGGMA